MNGQKLISRKLKMSETFCDIKCGRIQLNNKGIKEIFFSIIVTKVTTVGEKMKFF